MTVTGRAAVSILRRLLNTTGAGNSMQTELETIGRYSYRMTAFITRLLAGCLNFTSGLHFTRLVISQRIPDPTVDQCYGNFMEQHV